MRDDLSPACLPNPANASVEGFRAALATLGIRLIVRPPLRGFRRRILGAWDPALRRIELFLDPQVRESPTKTLAHELGHAFGADSQDEPAAEALAARWLDSVPESRIVAWDEALHAEAADLTSRPIAARGRDDCVLPP